MKIKSRQELEHENLLLRVKNDALEKAYAALRDSYNIKQMKTGRADIAIF